jgi:hypothetical protein
MRRELQRKQVRRIMTALTRGLMILVAMTALSVPPAQAQAQRQGQSQSQAMPTGKLDLAKMKCKEFFANPRDQLALIIGYLVGQRARGSQVLDFDQVRQNGEKLGGLCARNPDKDFMTAAVEVMGQ